MVSAKTLILSCQTLILVFVQLASGGMSWAINDRQADALVRAHEGLSRTAESMTQVKSPPGGEEVPYRDTLILILLTLMFMLYFYLFFISPGRAHDSGKRPLEGRGPYCGTPIPILLTLLYMLYFNSVCFPSRQSVRHW